ncbi:44636_t:CDS:2, partial [Gigaspora margarita]
ACITLDNHSFYSILQIKKYRYWPKNIPCNITDALENEYGSFVNIVLLASCSTTVVLGSEIKRYIKNFGDVIFYQPVIFDEFCECKSAADILNNLCNNTLSYHDVLVSKCSVDHIFAFYLS